MLTAGARLGPYEVLSPLGAGGMGEVWRARDERLGRDVAIKVLPAAFAADADRLRRFEQEARATGALNHPNILTVFDVGSAPVSFRARPAGAGRDEESRGVGSADQPGDGEVVHYLIEELLEGESLRTLLEGGPLCPRKSIEYGTQIAQGLAAAHAKGIVHRDLKPDNLFLTKDGHVKILDFGLAKLTRPEPPEDGTTATPAPSTETGMVMGTAGYMAPEQVRGLPCDHRVDIFALGCMLYEMLSGRRAFAGTTPADTMSAILSTDPPPLATSGRPVPPALQEVVSRCLEKRPEDRFSSAHDLAFSLAMMSRLSGVPNGQRASAPGSPGPPRRRWLVAAASLAGAASLGVGVFLLGQHSSKPPVPRFQRLTFRRGNVSAARFAPDGRTVVYSAEWDGAPGEVFSVRLESPESRPLGYVRAHLLAVAPSSELAILRDRRPTGWYPAATLAFAPFSGGTPRDLEERITFADFSPDGREMAVVRQTDNGCQLEYPMGTVLARSASWFSNPRISPDGQLVAFVDQKVDTSEGSSVAVVDRTGKRRTLVAPPVNALGLAWSPRGDEVWFTASTAAGAEELRAVTLGGRERTVLVGARDMLLEDVSRDGRLLVSMEDSRARIFFRGEGDAAERELSWLDWSLLHSLSPDGRRIAFCETGEGAGTNPTIYVRETSGTLPVKLGSGQYPSLSPDGRSVVAVRPGVAGPGQPYAIVVYPLGAGKETVIPIPDMEVDIAGMLPDSRTLWFTGVEPNGGTGLWRLWLTDLAGAKPRAILPEGVRAGWVTPDGKYATGWSGDAKWLYPLAGGEPRRVAGIQKDEGIMAVSADGQSIYVSRESDIPAKVYRVDVKTGHRELAREITPADLAGLGGLGIPPIGVRITPDGKNYAYGTYQILSELYLIEGLK